MTVSSPRPRRGVQLGLLLGGAVALGTAPGALAQPGNVEWKVSSSIGFEDAGTLYTRLEKPLTWRVEGGTPGATVRIYADAILLTEKRLGSGKGTLTAKNLFDLLGEGTFTIRAAEVIEDVEGASADFLTLVVDRTAPGVASVPDLDPTTDTGIADDDDITAAEDLQLLGTGEVGAWVFVAVDGKAKNTKKINRALGQVAGDGSINVLFDDAKNGEQLLSFALVDGAGNVTISPNTLFVEVSVKKPKAPKKVDLSEDDKFSTRPVLVTGDRTPNLVGEGIPGSVINLYERGETMVLGTGVVEPDGEWEVGVASDLAFGVQELVATQTDLAGAESKPSGRLTFFVFDETNGGRPFDNFNDNLLDPELWVEIETDPGALRVIETAERLEFPMFGGFSSDPEIAGYLSNAWALSLDEDWRVQVDFRIVAPALTAGDVGLLIAFLGDADFDPVQTIDGVEFLLGRDEQGKYFGFNAVEDGDVAFDDFKVRGGDTGTIFLWYDESTDAIYLSGVSFNGPAALVAANVRANLGYDRLSVFIAAFAERTFPIVDGPKIYFDDFDVDAGMMVETDLGVPAPLPVGYIPPAMARFAPSARFEEEDLDELLQRRDDDDDGFSFAIHINLLGGCGPADVNHDGRVDSRDVGLVIIFMGSHAFGAKHCDVDRNGIVDDRDLRAVLTVIGR